MMEALMETLLRFPRARDDRRRMPLLAVLESDARLGAIPVAPRRPDQHLATVAVHRPGDRAQAVPVSARIFARDNSQVARELRGPLEASPVDDLRREHHDRVERDAAEALQRPTIGAKVGRSASCSICRSSSSRRCSLNRRSA